MSQHKTAVSIDNNFALSCGFYHVIEVFFQVISQTHWIDFNIDTI